MHAARMGRNAKALRNRGAHLLRAARTGNGRDLPGVCRRNGPAAQRDQTTLRPLLRAILPAAKRATDCHGASRGGPPSSARTTEPWSRSSAACCWITAGVSRDGFLLLGFLALPSSCSAAAIFSLVFLMLAPPFAALRTRRLGEAGTRGRFEKMGRAPASGAVPYRSCLFAFLLGVVLAISRDPRPPPSARLVGPGVADDVGGPFWWGPVRAAAT